MAGVEGQMAEGVKKPRYRVEIDPKTGDHKVLDTKTGELLDVHDCVALLNRNAADV